MRETLKKFRAFYFPQHQAPTNRCTDIKTEASNFRYSLLCGKGGIRTPGASQHGGFQDRCNRPLYHLSSAYCELSFSKAMQRYGFFLNHASFSLFFFKKSTKKYFFLSFTSTGTPFQPFFIPPNVSSFFLQKRQKKFKKRRNPA